MRIGGETIPEQAVRIHCELSERPAPFTDHRIHFLDPETDAPLSGFPYGSCGHPVNDPNILKTLEEVKGKIIHFLGLRYKICSDTTGGNIVDAPRTYDYVGPIVGICFQKLDDSGNFGKIINVGMLE
ncbi:MAG: hypothetical protein PHQ95_01835 [Candidatus Gracilibacteria bacterium]|nr:hypothetical protein [Candidatus Gracilibacteria bacterium]